MSEHGQDASFFTHRLLVATPEGFGPETSAAIDRYVLSQIGRRWKGAFARLRSGVYLFRVEEENESEANSLVLILSIALFGRISSPACAFAPISADEDAERRPIKLEPVAAERLTKTLAAHAHNESGAAPAQGAAGAAIGSLEAAVRETKESVAEMRGEVGAIAEKLIQAEAAPAVADAEVSVDPAEKPMFQMARSGAVVFATTAKAMSRRVDAAVEALEDAVRRIDAAAPAEAVEAPARSGPSEETMRGLAENLAALARGQALIAATLKTGGAAVEAALTDGVEAVDDAAAEEDAVETADATPIEEPVEEPIEESVEEPVEEPVVEPIEEPIEEQVEDPIEEPAMDEAGVGGKIAALGEKIESVERALDALTDRVGALGDGATADLALVLDEMSSIGEDCRTALEQMLDVAIAWRRSVEAAETADADEPAADASHEAVDEEAEDGDGAESDDADAAFADEDADAFAVAVEDAGADDLDKRA